MELVFPPETSLSAFDNKQSLKMRKDCEAWQEELRLPLTLDLYAIKHEHSHTTPVVALAMLLAVREAIVKSLRRSAGPVEDTLVATSDTCERLASTPWLPVRDD
jgi:hypothetical protein